MTSKDGEPHEWRDFVSNDSAVLDEIIRQAELRLQAQLQCAIAADSRAGLMASIQAAGAAALMIYAGGEKVPVGPATGAVVTAAVLTLGAILAAIAARPVAFGYPGTRPSDWIEDLDKETIVSAKAGTAVWYDKYLRMNDAQIAANNRWIRWSLITLVLSPFVGGIAFLTKQIWG